MISSLTTPSRFLALLSALLLACLAQADEIVLNTIQTPDEVGAFYIDDLENSGDPKAGACRIDQLPFSLQVGDIAGADLPGLIRKNFLLFLLPELQGRTVKHAALRLTLSRVLHEGAAKLPPAFLLHAKQWEDGAWSADPRLLGLRPTDYADVENFSTKVPLCGSGDAGGSPLEIDVTEMIRSDYKRGDFAVAVFRMEVADQQTLDVTDGLSNQYVLPGPGQTNQPERVLPSLVLTLE